MRSYEHLWQQEEHADVEVVLTVPDQGSSAGTCKLAAFPGHGLLLSDSPVFKAQILRWQNKRQHGEAFDTSAQAEQAAAGSSAMTQLVLTLDAADQQPAALAVLQSLYHGKQESELVAGLTQEQQLQAVLLADMWQVPDVGTAAADALTAAAEAAADGRLSEATTQKFLSMPAVPACLEPLVKKVLLSLFGDLEAVWADEALQQQLMGLPLHAMKLLLSFDELKVASEDTVLCTARCFAKKQTTNRRGTSQQLMSVIRCPNLSPYWLSALATSSIAVPAELLPHLQNLMLARTTTADYQVTAQQLQAKGDFAGAPACLALPKRAIQPVSSVQVTWELPIDELRAAAQRSVADGTAVSVLSPHTTPPFAGVRYHIQLQCTLKDGGCCVGLSAIKFNVPKCMGMPYAFTWSVAGTQVTKAGLCPAKLTLSWGWSNFFGVPPMAGGWDEAAWAAKGLPTSGTLPITLTVSAPPQAEAPVDAVANAGRGRGRGRRRGRGR